MNRRSIIKGLGAIGASTALPAWAQGAPAFVKGTTLTISTWGVFQDQIKAIVQPEFEKATGARLAYDLGNQGARYNKILSQRNTPPADVFISADDIVVAGLRAGVLQPMPRKAVSRVADTCNVPNGGCFDSSASAASRARAFEPMNCRAPLTTICGVYAEGRCSAAA